ncbi:uncharacterized protein Dwil_GK20846 [Drosophila willistoni]|uniref:FXNA-like protease n=1 Tax=Drosophila willistoni TaxID=7260 RepID=B4MJJ7_DROWI|nr:endoplasmic reticulum metallopeptidase 1 [Drosophila willistoni]EDW72286.1 uncharacterized protein Dwil_GK20846 [Drosophila willistoni]
MGDKDKLINDESIEEGSTTSITKKVAKVVVKSQLPWYFGTGSLLFWGLLFFSIVIPLFYRLPTPLTINDSNKGVFIAERAYNTLSGLASIGTKVVGSQGNEVDTVQYLLNQLAIIKEEILDDLFDLEIDIQRPTGSYIWSLMTNHYHNIQNIVVKLSPKNSTSETYLLVNSHFDSKPTSPSVGDAGHMIVSVLEVLRVIGSSRQTFTHPIVFLLNGAEENPLQGSHGFITQHKWAPFCKAVINLDAAGSGGREILFQSGPDSSWLTEYYKKNAKHPFGTSMAEELFQTGLLPSDTDFGIFNTYGGLSGFDIAQVINGYVYHTLNDRLDVIPIGALQNTGDNLLGLVRALSNATELFDPEAYETGHAIFFDVLGLYLVTYSATNAVYFNYAVAGATILLVFLSLWRIAVKSNITLETALLWGIVVLVIQVIGFVLGVALPIVVAYVMDKYGLSLSYFSHPILLIGLYVCPSLLGLSLPSYIYFKLQRNPKISYPSQIQLALHGYAVVLAVLAIALNYYGLRTTYVFTWTLIFYVIPLALNLLLTLQDRGYAWTALLKIAQVFPFLYNSYLFYTFITALTPMMGRYGASTNPDLIVSALTALGALLSLGFLILLVNIYRRPSLVFLVLLAISGVTIYAATSTQVGFPYRAKTNVQRVPYLQVRRTFYEYDGTVSKDESGYLFNFQDRRKQVPFEDYVNLTGIVSLEDDCDKYMFCGVPLFDSRWVKAKAEAMWLPREDPINPPSIPTLELLNKTVLADSTSLYLEFNLTGPDHMSIFLQPYEDVTISNWTFAHTMLENSTTYPTPYHVYHSYGINDGPLNFFLQLEKPDGDFDVPLLQVGISGHFIGNEGDKQAIEFADSFPPFSALVEWPASYHRYIY